MTELVQAEQVESGGDLPERPERGRVRRTAAIVGMGLKGLSVLERLLAEAAATPRIAWAIDLFEPHTVPGAGARYDPSQPSYLRMDQPAGEISLWETAAGVAPPWGSATSSGLPSVVEPQSLLQWADERGYRIGPDDYVPRALVGRYLHDAFCRLCTAAPPNVTLSLVPHKVEGVRRRGGRQWVLEHRQLASEMPRRPQRLPIRREPTAWQYDQVFVTAGERCAAGDVCTGSWRNEADRWRHPLIESVYPTRQRLSLTEVPPRRSVAVSGLFPAAIDAILALTEGRGGLFVAAGGVGQPEWRYLRGWREPSRICVFSADGRLPAPRPLPAVESGAAEGVATEVAALWQQGRRALTQSRVGSDGRWSLWHDFLPALIDCTVARWQLGRPERQSREKIRRASDRISRRLHAVAAGRPATSVQPVAAHTTPAEAWRQAALIAWGARPLTLTAASVQAWRQLAPPWIGAFDADRSVPRELAALRRLARYFGELMSGPPVATVARMLALVDAGLMDLSFYRGPQVTVEPAGFRLRAGGAVTICRTLVAPTAASPLPLTAAYAALRPTPWDGLFVVGRSHDAGIGDGADSGDRSTGVEPSAPATLLS